MQYPGGQQHAFDIRYRNSNHGNESTNSPVAILQQLIDQVDQQGNSCNGHEIDPKANYYDLNPNHVDDTDDVQIAALALQYYNHPPTNQQASIQTHSRQRWSSASAPDSIPTEISFSTNTSARNTSSRCSNRYTAADYASYSSSVELEDCKKKESTFCSYNLMPSMQSLVDRHSGACAAIFVALCWKALYAMMSLIIVASFVTFLYVLIVQIAQDVDLDESSTVSSLPFDDFDDDESTTVGEYDDNICVWKE